MDERYGSSGVAGREGAGPLRRRCRSQQRSRPLPHMHQTQRQWVAEQQHVRAGSLEHGELIPPCLGLVLARELVTW